MVRLLLANATSDATKTGEQRKTFPSHIGHSTADIVARSELCNWKVSGGRQRWTWYARQGLQHEERRTRVLRKKHTGERRPDARSSERRSACPLHLDKQTLRGLADKVRLVPQVLIPTIMDLFARERLDPAGMSVYINVHTVSAARAVARIWLPDELAPHGS